MMMARALFAFVLYLDRRLSLHQKILFMLSALLEGLIAIEKEVGLFRKAGETLSVLWCVPFHPFIPLRLSLNARDARAMSDNPFPFPYFFLPQGSIRQIHHRLRHNRAHPPLRNIQRSSSSSSFRIFLLRAPLQVLQYLQPSFPPAPAPPLQHVPLNPARLPPLFRARTRTQTRHRSRSKFSRPNYVLVVPRPNVYFGQ